MNPTARWPELPYDGWKDTYATLHMWMQIVGKVALTQSPPLNHSWGVAMQVTPSGVSTRTLAQGERSFTIEFDFMDHRLVVRTSDGATRALALAPPTVAEFYRLVMDLLSDLSLPVKIWPTPVEVPNPIRFTEDTVHASYDPESANRFWRILVQVDRVLSSTRCSFIGKASPVWSAIILFWLNLRL